MLGLLVLATVAHAMQPQAIATGFRSIFTTGDRNSTFIDSDMDRRAQILMIFLSICTFSMAVYVSLLANTGAGEYSFRTFGLIVLITLGILTVRMLLERPYSDPFLRSSTARFRSEACPSG